MGLRFFFLFFLIVLQNTTAKVILVPDDYLSVQEAVEASSSGDEIQITTNEVYWLKYEVSFNDVYALDARGIVVENKDLTIAGVETITSVSEQVFDDYHDKSAFIRLINSDVEIKNLQMTEPLKGQWIMQGTVWGGTLTSPMIIESGHLTITNSEIVCLIENYSNLTIENSIFRGNSYMRSYAYSSQIRKKPAILCATGTVQHVQIINSQIESYSAYNTLEFRNVSNGLLEIVDSEIYGFNAFSGGSGRNAVDVIDSANLKCLLSNARFIGGDGYRAYYNRGYMEMSGIGGDGLFIKNSTVELRDQSGVNEILGGSGGNGSINKDIIGAVSDFENYIVNGNSGGHGISLHNSTLISTNPMSEIFIHTQGGAGGEGSTYLDWSAEPGDSGQAIYLDESSSIIEQSHVPSWSIYQ